MYSALARINSHHWFIKIYDWIILAFVFSLPLFPILLPKIIILWVLFWILEGDFKNKLVNFKQKKLIFCLLIGFYIYHVIGLLYSHNVAVGLFDIEVKASFLVFPFLLLSKRFQQASFRRKILFSFVSGVLLALIFCLIRAWYRTLTIDDATFMRLFGWGTAAEHLFFYQQFSYFLHSSYFSMYILFGIVCLIYFFEIAFITKYWKIFIFIFILFSLAGIYLLSSKAGLIALIGVIIISCFYYLLRTKNVVISFFLILVGLLVSFLIFFLNPRTKWAIKEIKNEQIIIHDSLQKEPIKIQQSATSLSLEKNDRFSIWKHSLEIIKTNFLIGVGCGDIKDELLKIYSKYQLNDAAKNKLNLHNQYLETAIGQGIIGFILLLILLLWPFVLAIRQKDILGIGFITVIAINFMFESMLNTQAGVVFFAFFYCFLFIAMEPNKKASEINKIT